MDPITFADIFQGGVGLSTLFLILLFVYKALPIWKEVRLAETGSITALASSLGRLAESQTSLAQSQTRLAEVVNNVAIEQRKATDQIKILQRINTEAVDSLTERMQDMETKK